MDWMKLCLGKCENTDTNLFMAVVNFGGDKGNRKFSHKLPSQLKFETHALVSL